MEALRRLASSVTTYRLIQLAMLVILGTAFATSFKSGADGALRLGYEPGFKISLPVVCDVFAGVATVIHGRVRSDKKMRRLAAWFVLFPMLLSWASNSVDHSYRAAAAADSWSPAARTAWYGGVILAAGICPVAVAGLLHLSTKYQEFEQRQSRITKPLEPRGKLGRKPAAKPTAAVTPPAQPRSELGDRSQQRVAMVMWAQRQPELPPLKRIQSEFKVSLSTAKRVRRDAVSAAS